MILFLYPKSGTLTRIQLEIFWSGREMLTHQYRCSKYIDFQTTRSLFDSNNWCQDDVGNEQFEFVERSVRPSTRRIPNRENTYMVRSFIDDCCQMISLFFQYIDAVSRGPTSKSRIHPMEQYGWRTGRLRDWQVNKFFFFEILLFEYKFFWLNFLYSLLRSLMQ